MSIDAGQLVVERAIAAQPMGEKKDIMG